MFWSNNNPHTPVDDPNKFNPLSLNTPNPISQPSPFINNKRGRFNSFNSFVSPMRLIQSPNISDVENFF
jgi:hypothetical protein